MLVALVHKRSEQASHGFVIEVTLNTETRKDKGELVENKKQEKKTQETIPEGGVAEGEDEDILEKPNETL